MSPLKSPIALPRTVAYFAAVMLWGWKANAEPGRIPAFHVERIQVDAGLPSNTILGLTQSADGFLWIATPKALAWSDGDRYHALKWPAEFTVETEPVLAMGAWTDGTGGGWLARGRQVLLYDRAFLRSVAPPMASPMVCVLEAGGALYVGDAAGETLRWSHEAWTAASDRLAGEPASFLSTGDQALWAMTKDGRVWRKARGGLELNAEPWQPIRAGVLALGAATDGNAWVATGDGMFTARGATLVPSDDPPAPGSFRRALPAPDHGVWLDSGDALRLWRDGRWNSGITPLPGGQYDPVVSAIGPSGALWQIHPIPYPSRFWCRLSRLREDGRLLWFGVSDGLPFDNIRCLTEDDGGGLWLGAEHSGLVRLSEEPFRMITQRNGLLDSYISCLFESREGALWIGTSEGGLYQKTGERLIHVPIVDSAGEECIRSVAEDGDGALWVSIKGAGLFSSRDGSSWTARYTAAEVDGQPRTLFLDSAKRLWMGNAAGASCRPPEGPLQFWTGGTLLEDADVRAIAEFPAGTLWFASNRRGLLRMQGDKLERIAEKEIPVGLHALHFDSDGILWLGTAGAGLARFDGKRATVFDKAQGLPDAWTASVVSDAEHLWVGTHAGLVRLQRRELAEIAGGRKSILQSRVFDERDGLASRECSAGRQSLALRLSSGQCALATSGGVALFHPQSLGKDPAIRAPVLEETTVDEAPAVWAGKSLVAPPGARELALRFTTPMFGDLHPVHFRYSLTGYDSTYVETSGERTARYVKPPPGAYEFRVAAGDGRGNWGPFLRVPVTIRAHWWQRPWILSAGLLAVAVGLSLALRQRALRRLGRQLEASERAGAIERERSRIARDLHDDLGASLTRIALLSESARTLPEADGSDLRELHATANEVIGKMEETVWALNPERDSVESLVNYLAKYLQTAAARHELRCRLEIPGALPQRLIPGAVRHNIFLAVKEALHNSMKHAGAREVRLLVEADGHRLRLGILDDGRGFDIARPGAGGNGLDNMRARLHDSGGTCQIRSQPGEGAAIFFEIPL